LVYSTDIQFLIFLMGLGNAPNPARIKKQKGARMPKITPYLWFESKAEEAVNFYVSIFRDSKIMDITKFDGKDVGQEGAVVSITFQLEGQQFYALNGGPQFAFSPAVSFYIDCETQQEIDHYWEKLSCGGEKQMCGWLKDKYGRRGRLSRSFWAR